MSSQQYHDLKVSIDKHVALIVISRPKAHNCFHTRMRDELIRAYGELEADSHVRVIILTGDPAGKCFCAGADLSQTSFTTPAQGSNISEEDFREDGGKVALPILRSRKITIAAINGNAAGIGITMTLPMDLRFAWKDAKIVFPFLQRGIVPEATSTYQLPLLIGRSRAMAVLLQGTSFPASSPLLDGLFTKILDTKESVLPYALTVAHELSTNLSPTATAIMKSLVLNPKPTADEQHILESRAIFITTNGDGKEGVRSYLEKRPPQFGDYDTRSLPKWFKGKL
ncbi:hypothetical protein Clacol_003049 [Clathrus columnatus]|uniref:Enoyl-CoA hydratase n=1 Tax=Clathrus columnatus TaxID=1419009 RepID=A0AAV5AA81_9AGAM|nr:hypothetical protein Clacol_003049 [Clathrus columnatus]